MNKGSKIYIAGHKGLVGSAIFRCLSSGGYNNLLFRTFEELDLTDQYALDTFFSAERPEYVFLAAALVGGIGANTNMRADFIYQNIMIQSNIIHSSWKYGIKKLLFLGSTCIYPKNAAQPLREDYLLTSSLEYTNEPYAIAKITGLKMCESYNIQYKTNFIAVMPTNLYGPGDNFNLEKSHVLPALLRKIHLGKCLEDNNWDSIRKDLNKNPIDDISGSSDVSLILKVLNRHGVMIIHDSTALFGNTEETSQNIKKVKVAVRVWGSGKPLREFMYSSDLAEACVYLMENIDIQDIIKLNKARYNSEFNTPHFVNIGTGKEISISDLLFKIKNLVGFTGEITYDTSKPDGTMRKVTDITLLGQLGYKYRYDLDAGLKLFYQHYISEEI